MALTLIKAINTKWQRSNLFSFIKEHHIIHKSLMETHLLSCPPFPTMAKFWESLFNLLHSAWLVEKTVCFFYYKLIYINMRSKVNSFSNVSRDMERESKQIYALKFDILNMYGILTMRASIRD